MPGKISQTVGGYEIEFVPMEAGPHRVDVDYAGVHVPASPVIVMAYDVSRIRVLGVVDGLVGNKSAFSGRKDVCVCVCVISFTTIRPWALISLRNQLYAAAPESSFPLGDKLVSQPAPFQTIVGHSVIVVRHVCIVLSVTLYLAT